MTTLFSFTEILLFLICFIRCLIHLVENNAVCYFNHYQQVSGLNLDKPVKGSNTSTDSKSDDGTDEQISPAEKSLLQKIIRKGLIETTKDLEIQRKDPSSPLYSVKTFEALHL